MSRRFWTDAERQMLREHFANTRTDDLAAALGRTYSQTAQQAAKLGLKKSATYLAGPDAHRFDGKKGSGTRIQPGAVPWNKGRQYQPGGRCAETQFRDGNVPQTWRQIGSTRVIDGLLERKVSDTRVRKVDWVPVQRLVWEAANGPIPADHVVVFKPGRKTIDPDAITQDALECLSRADLMRRNTYHNLPKELASVIQLRGAIARQINKRAKAAA